MQRTTAFSALLIPLLTGSLGCELIAQVDRSTVGEGQGGAGGEGGQGGQGGQGGVCVPQEDGNECTDDVCESGMPINKPTAVGTACTTGGTQCDGMGKCVECLAATDCPGMDDACQARTCMGGTCGIDHAVLGTVVPNQQTMGDCQQAVCDGNGAIVQQNDDADVPPDDADPCTVPACNAGQASTANAMDGTACNDADACTQTDACQAGSCMGANLVVCMALDACHAVGTCDSTTGMCSNPPQMDGFACSDGDACTQTDACQAGSCMGANPVVCMALDTCHVAGMCDSGTGMCSNPPQTDGFTCNDGDACTQTDACQAGMCQGANPLVCGANEMCTAGTCVCSNLTFPATVITMGQENGDVEAADLDGDGKLDLITVEALFTPNVSVSRGLGDGTFAPPVQYAGALSNGLVAADLNGDTKLDVALVESELSGSVRVLLNQGDGTLAPNVSYPAGGIPYGIAAADVNDDLKMDLAVSYFGANFVSVYIGNGDGSFAAKIDYPAMAGFGPSDIKARDFTSDGKPDLAFSRGSTVNILVNQGNGTFGAVTSYPVGSSRAESLDVADVNGDGKLDIVAAFSGATHGVSVLLNLGGGSFAAAVNYPVMQSSAAVAAGDLDGDGDADLAVASLSTNVYSVLLNQGNGTFGAATTYPYVDSVYKMTTADLNADGRSDIVIGGGNFHVTVALSTCAP